MIRSEEISYQDVLADVSQPVLLKDFSIDSKWKTILRYNNQCFV